MILTVTLNPLLERRYKYNSIKLNTENRNGEVQFNAGGKGINVSRQLNHLGIDNLAFTFTGGVNGKILREILIKENIKITAIKSSGDTRDAAVIIDESQKNITTYFAKNSSITKTEVDEFNEKLEKMIQNCEIVVLSGSSPCEETDSIFPLAIETANKFDKISLLDTYGNHLQNCINASPTILHNNISELENSLNLDLKSEQNKIDFLDELYTKGIKQAFLTNGKENAYASNFDYHFEIQNPSVEIIDATGSGDSFVAGIIYGWHHNLTFNENVQIASSLGAVNASQFDVCNVKPEDFEELKSKVMISPIGKKMKTLDVTPR